MRLSWRRDGEVMQSCGSLFRFGLCRLIISVTAIMVLLWVSLLGLGYRCHILSFGPYLSAPWTLALDDQVVVARIHGVYWLAGCVLLANEWLGRAPRSAGGVLATALALMVVVLSWWECNICLRMVPAVARDYQARMQFLDRRLLRSFERISPGIREKVEAQVREVLQGDPRNVEARAMFVFHEHFLRERPLVAPDTRMLESIDGGVSLGPSACSVATVSLQSAPGALGMLRDSYGLSWRSRGCCGLWEGSAVRSMSLVDRGGN